MKLVFSTIIAFIAVANAVPIDLGFDGQSVPKNVQAKFNKVQGKAMEKVRAKAEDFKTIIQQRANAYDLDIDTDKLLGELKKSIPENALGGAQQNVMQNFNALQGGFLQMFQIQELKRQIQCKNAIFMLIFG